MSNPNNRNGNGGDPPDVDVTGDASQGASGIAQIGKIPGAMHDVSVTGQQTVRELFSLQEIKVDQCEIQINGQTAGLDDVVEAGDTVLAIARIRGN